MFTRLELISTMRIYDVFHTNLLHPSNTNPFPDQNDVEPQPMVVQHEGEE